MRKVTGKLVATSILTAVVLAGCGSDSGGSQGQETESVQLAFSNPTIFTTGFPHYVAQEQGFYEDANLDVDATFTGGGAETVQAVVSGSADVGTETSGPAAIGAFSEGAPVNIVSASTTGLDLYWFVKGNSNIDGPEGLAGETMGFSTTGSSSNIGVLALSNALSDQGLEPINPEAVGGPSDNFTAVQTDQITAGWSQPPILLNEVDNGELKIAAEGSDIGEYEDVAVRVSIANSQWAQQNPEALRRFLEVQKRSWDWIFNNQQEAVRIWKEQAELDDSEQTLLRAFDFYEREDMRIAPLDGRETIVRDAVRFDFVQQEPSEEELNELFDLSYLPEEDQ